MANDVGGREAYRMLLWLEAELRQAGDFMMRRIS